MAEAPSLEEAFRRNPSERLTLWKTEKGWQANVQNKSTGAWRVEIDTDPTVALLRALGPHYGQSWDDHLLPEPFDDCGVI